MYESKELAEKICGGYILNETEAYALLDMPPEELRRAALQVSRQMMPRKFDSCSIINARSGHCSENCKWCAQSAHFATGCQNYDVVDHDECLREARYNHERGIARFSLVGSGRAVRGEAFGKVCAMLREIHETVGIKTCASLGLLDRESLRELRRSGVTRYHCNLETAPSFFGTLCTTHTIEDKIHTIEMAREEGLEVCSGGIIGMGEGIKFINSYGQMRIYKKEIDILSHIYDKLQSMKNIVLYTQRPNIDYYVPVLSFNVKGKNSEEVAEVLSSKYNIAVRAGLHCAPLAHKSIGTLDIGTVRIVPSVFTTNYDVNALISAIYKII